MTIAPCKDCANRKVGCHSTCELYIQWKQELDSVNQSKRLERDIEAYHIGEAIKRKAKRSRR